MIEQINTKVPIIKAQEAKIRKKCYLGKSHWLKSTIFEFFRPDWPLITVGHFRKFPALENFPCWKFTRWKSVAGNAGKMEKF